MNRISIPAYVANCFVPFAVFLAVSLFLSYGVLFLPSPVIGDNPYWAKPTTLDILGPKTFRESFLGDVAVMSTFKNGFLFPLVYSFVMLNLPISTIYPFLFYLLCMLSFYSFSREFLHSTILRLTISLMYVINPITPFYFASILSAFALVFVPFALKFFAKALRDVTRPYNRDILLKNYVLAGVFLSLAVSAHEQFFLSCALVGTYISVTFLTMCLKRYGVSRQFALISMINICVFSFVFVLINAPLILSLSNVSNAPFATYFTGRFRDFLANVRYTYASAGLITLLRFGGDSGVGLGSSAWYDASSFTNVFGYAVFVLFLVSVFLLVRKDRISGDKPFFYMNVILFMHVLLLIELIKYLPSNPKLAENLFSFLLQTWQSPIRLRVLLLLSGLTTTFVVLRRLEISSISFKGKILRNFVVLLLLGTTIIYNSPWLIGYAGHTPLQQIAVSLNWGKLFDDECSRLADFLGRNYSDERGIAIPYTHKAELYLPPNFRLFQLTSAIDEEMTKLTQTGRIPWSNLLGLLSAKYVVTCNQSTGDEAIIFPKLSDKDAALVLENLHNDTGLRFKESLGNYSIFENENALPKVYATRFFVFYDDMDTIKYASQKLDFKKRPVFLNAGTQINQLSIPTYIVDDLYEVNAVSLDGETRESNITLTVVDGANEREISLSRVGQINGANLFSNSVLLSPGDTLGVPNTSSWNETLSIDELVVDSDQYPIGHYGSFMLNFTIGIIRKGQNSFLGPRVIVDTDTSKRYFLIFHDNGFLELAVQQGESFASALMTTYAGYALDSQGDSIQVSVLRSFDEVKVYINTNLIMTFAIEPKISSVYLASEHSASRFTEITAETKEILKLFAVRQFVEPLDFSVRQADADKAVLVVKSDYPEYAVVSQYLYTSLRGLRIPKDSDSNVLQHSVNANAFFQGWILQGTEATETLRIEIDIQGSEAAFVLTFISISLTSLVLIVAAFNPRFLLRWLRDLLERVRSIRSSTVARSV